MKRARRLSQRLIRWTSLCVCFALVITSFVLFPSQVSIGKNRRSGKPSANSGAQGNGQERRVAPRPPEPGPPPGKFPNLDEMRSATDQERRNGGRRVHAPDPVPSTQRRWKHGNTGGGSQGQGDSKANHARTARAVLPLPQGTDDMAMARIDPYNRTGTGGVDLLSQNFNWSLGQVGLKGRGLDLGLALSYNSLSMWTRSGNDVTYNVDQDSLAPGFRLGFPVVQGPYNHSQASTLFYILITPSGQHVELRRVGTSSVYQAVDASYAQFDSSNLTFLSQGTQLTFAANPGNTEYHCTEVKDRNGNYISVAYNSTTGNISTVTDTLGRVITFNYDSYNNIQTITQPWGSATHTWASFGWTTTTIGSIFSGLNYSGPTRGNGNTISVLDWVGRPDGSRYYFDYDGSYGMVTKIRYHAWDGLTNGQPGHERRQVSYGYDTSGGGCPRVSSEKDWAENWNGDTNGVPATSEEVTTSFSQSSGVGTMTLSDDTVYKEFYGSTWKSGLVTMTKNYATTSAASSDSDSSPTWKKKTTTAWTQDNINVSYLLNPRVTQTNIDDSENNHKKTTISYQNPYNALYEQYSLPYLVQEYDGDSSTVLRNTYTDYNLDQSYLDRRIIGLVSAVHVSDSAWQSKTTYEYDSTSIDSQAASTTHHDSAYSTSFAARGNVTAVWHWDVTDINNTSKARGNHMTYDAAGSVLTSTDPLSHSNSMAYSSTYYYAYPTTMSDAASNSSTVQYDFDTGAVTQTQGPPPYNQSAAMTQSMSYDSAGRLQWITRPDGFWRYIAYADRGDAVLSQVSIAEYPTSAWSITVVDGGDRTRLVGRDLPDSTGGYAGAFALYDNMGRVSQQSNVEETNAYWSPAGDDSAGWVFPNATVYDWKGRPTRTYNMDGTYNEASYTGCVGAAVVVTRDEIGRRQKTTFDPLGRLKKTEILYETSKSTALDGSGTVYSTTENTFDALDHVKQVTQTDNQTSAYQTTTMTFDGYGRLASKHVPEQSANTATTYSYNDDDTVHVVTDARGASATYSYNSRRLVTGISYYAPSGVASTPNVSFDYDAAGNRTSMTDGIGSVSYSYDTLSRLTSETRSFTDLSASYTLSYSYNLGGELTGLTDNSLSTTVTYAYDGTGRLTAVGGSGFPNFSTFASNFAYRAWGAIKAFDYGNSVHQAVGFNARQQITSNTYSNVHKGSNSSATIANSYEYFDDGRNSHVTSGIDNKFDRAYTFDHVGRLYQALTGAEARGGTTADGPYKQTYSYDVWTNTTSLTSRIWTQNNSDGGNFTNNRRQYWSYDADGHATDASTDTYSYDVTAKPSYYATGWVGSYRALEVASSYDGSGASAKQVETRAGVLYDENNEPSYYTDDTTKYLLRSTVLGGKVIGEIAPGGTRMSNHVYAGGMELAQASVSGSTTYVNWQHIDPITGSSFVTDRSRTFGTQKELGTLGEDVTTAPPAAPTFPAILQPVWPAEYTWGPSEEYEKGNQWWAGIMSDWVHDRETLGALERAAKHGDRSKIEELLHKNPNIIAVPGGGAGASAFLKGDTSAGADGKNNGYVTVTATDLDEEYSDPQNPVPISPDELARIRGDVEKAISAKKCADYLTTLLDEAAVQTGEPYRDIMVTFDNTKFSYGDTGAYGGYANGSFENDTASAVITPFESNFISTDRSSFIRTQTAQNALGETLHHVGTHETYDDPVLANALNAVLVRQGKEAPRTFSGRTLAEVTTASRYFHERVFNACSMRY